MGCGSSSNAVDSGTPERPKEKTKETPKPKQQNSGNKFIDEAVAVHNKYRAKHGVPPLKHNQDLSDIAQRWADHLAKTGSFEHSKNSKYKGNPIGENLAYGSAGLSADAAVKMWYDEINEYDFGKQGFGMGTGHFTQVVWKGTEEVGLGCATGSNGFTVVANYYPAGNFMGQFEQNVSKPK